MIGWYVAAGLYVWAGFALWASVGMTLIAADGVPPRTLESYQAGEATPGLAYFLMLIAHLGPTFAAAVMEPAGVTAVLMDDAGDRPCPRSLNTAVASLAAAFAAANETGVNHTTEPDLKAAARELMPMLAAVVRDS